MVDGGLRTKVGGKKMTAEGRIKEYEGCSGQEDSCEREECGGSYSDDG